MKKVAIFILVFLVGCSIGALSTYHYLSKFMLHSMYMDAAGSVSKYAAILNAQNSGDYAQATEWLERFLSLEAIILEGCKNDLCKDQSIPQVEKSLAVAKDYKYTQYHP